MDRCAHLYTYLHTCLDTFKYIFRFCMTRAMAPRKRLSTNQTPSATTINPDRYSQHQPSPLSLFLSPCIGIQRERSPLFPRLCSVFCGRILILLQTPTTSSRKTPLLSLLLFSLSGISGKDGKKDFFCDEMLLYAEGMNFTTVREMKLTRPPPTFSIQ